MAKNNLEVVDFSLIKVSHSDDMIIVDYGQEIDWPLQNDLIKTIKDLNIIDNDLHIVKHTSRHTAMVKSGVKFSVNSLFNCVIV